MRSILPIVLFMLPLVAGCAVKTGSDSTPYVDPGELELAARFEGTNDPGSPPAPDGCDAEGACLRAPSPACDRWYSGIGGRLRAHPLTDPRARTASQRYPDLNGLDVRVTLIVASPATLDTLSGDPLRHCRSFKIAEAMGGYKALVARAAPLPLSRRLGSSSHAYVRWEEGGSKLGRRPPAWVKEMRFGHYLLVVTAIGGRAGDRDEPSAANDLDTITLNAYEHARRILGRPMRMRPSGAPTPPPISPP